MKELNKDFKKRDSILNIKSNWSDHDRMGGIRSFEMINLETLKKLRDNNFLYLEDQQNDSPSIEEFISTLEKYPSATVSGYAVSPYRPDYRISIDSIEIKANKKEIKKCKNFFIELSKLSSTFLLKKKRIYIWWD